MRALLQLTLDLFGAEVPPASEEKRPAAPAPPAEGATKSIANTDAAPLALAEALAPARFMHPRATRQVRLAGAHVGYEFVRGRRRTIGFVVGPEGLVVRAPRWVALRDVDAAVQEKGEWIVRKLDEARQRQARLAAARVEWREGATFPFLGATVQLRLDPAHRHAAPGGAMLQAEPEAPGAPRILVLALAHGATAEQIRDAAQAWLMRQARRVFTERLDHFAPQLGVRWRKLSLSNADTRWGSASADGAIRLHWRLIHFRLPVIDYVVAHELAHLRVMDHSPRFWETVQSVLPDYAQLRRQLRDEAVPRWD